MAIIRGTYVTRLSGTVGDVVYRMRNGANIASQKASQVKNPRTDAQQNQRMNMATVSAAYSALKVICDHSFEGKSYGSECMGEFMKRNLSIVKNLYYSLNGKGNPYIIPNSYMVSRGSLPSVAINELLTGSDGSFGIVINNTPNYEAAKITVAQFHELLGAQIGDQITILGVARVTDGERISWDGVSYQSQYAVQYARLVFNNDAGSELLLTERAINTANIDTTKSENVANVSVADNRANELLVSFTMPGCATEDDRLAATIILSRKTGTDWQRSTQILTVKDSSEPNQWNREEMLPTYAPTGNKYLNNATL